MIKTYTVRFCCIFHFSKDESVTKTDYELKLDATNLEEVYSCLDDYLEDWEKGASITLNAPGGRIAFETLEILNSEGEVLY